MRIVSLSYGGLEYSVFRWFHLLVSSKLEIHKGGIIFSSRGEIRQREVPKANVTVLL